MRKNRNIVSYYAPDDVADWLETQDNRSSAITDAIRATIKGVVSRKGVKFYGEGQITKALTVNKSNPNINVMFEQWATITGVPINGQQQANRRACSNLLKKYGTEKLTQLIQGVAKAQGEDFAPQIANFTQLQAKQDSLILWGRKQAQEENNSEVVKI